MSELHLTPDLVDSGDSSRALIPDRRLLRDHTPLFQWIQWLAHSSVIWLAFYWATHATSAGFSGDYRLLALITILAFSAMARFIGFYRRLVVGWLGSWRIFEVWVLTAVFVSLMCLAIGTFRRFDPGVLAFIFTTGFIGHAIVFHGAKLIAKFSQQTMQLNISAAVIGTGKLAAELVKKINGNNFLPDQVVGVVSNGEWPHDWRESDIPVIGDIKEATTLASSLHIDRFYICLPIERSDEIRQIQAQLLETNADVVWVPDIFSLELLNPSVREIGGLPLLSLSESPLISGVKAYIKSLTDLLLALALLVVLSPLFAVVAIIIKQTSAGPVFYRQQRNGWDGGVFEIWKFRSMRSHDESQGIQQATEDDRRITKFGQFIRRTSIDELPQLFNVIGGSMSLVGPRPHAIQHNDAYSKRLKSYMLRHRVKPGMTGWAQVHGYRGETDTLDKMRYRLEHDLYYINHWSLKLDLLIMVLTPLSLIRYRAI